MYCSIEDLPENKPILVCLGKLATTGIIKVTAKNFYTGEFDFGTPADMQARGICKKLKKYYMRRFFFFSKFDEGIQLDRESWYSVIAEPISLDIKQRLINSKIPLNTVFQGFCGTGGIAIHLAPSCTKYIANDLDPAKLAMLRHNMGVYSLPPESMEILNLDFLKVKPFPVDVLILCPPWGGIELDQYTYRDLDQLMKPALSDIINHGLKFSRNMILQMPKNTNVENLLNVVHKCCGLAVVQVDKIMVNDRPSQLLIYIGEQKFTKLTYKSVVETLCQHYDLNSKEEKQNLKKEFKTTPQKVLMDLYKSTNLSEETMNQDSEEEEDMMGTDNSKEGLAVAQGVMGKLSI